MDERIESRIDFSGLHETVAQIKTELKKIIVGQEPVIEQLIAAIIADGHVLIEGVPGVAKTMIAKVLAKTIDCQFSRIQFTPDLMPSDIIGTTVYNMKTSDFEFKKGPVFSNVILIDEINRAPAKTQAALFEVMEERQVTIDGVTHKMPPPFIVFATQNPVEHEGTYRLPEAELDRFLFKIEVGYPSLEEETAMLLDLHKRDTVNDLSMIQAILTPESLFTLRKLVRSIHIGPEIAGYITKIISQTRNSRDIFLGASPRASLAVLSGAKAFAAMQGRDFVIPDDVKEMVYPALRHRILLTAEREMEGLTAHAAITQVLNTVEVPR
jgi:MoxR-like ATPase